MRPRRRQQADPDRTHEQAPTAVASEPAADGRRGAQPNQSQTGDAQPGDQKEDRREGRDRHIAREVTGIPDPLLEVRKHGQNVGFKSRWRPPIAEHHRDERDPKAQGRSSAGHRKPMCRRERRRLRPPGAVAAHSGRQAEHDEHSRQRPQEVGDGAIQREGRTPPGGQLWREHRRHGRAHDERCGRRRGRLLDDPCLERVKRPIESAVTTAAHHQPRAKRREASDHRGGSEGVAADSSSPRSKQDSDRDRDRETRHDEGDGPDALGVNAARSTARLVGRWDGPRHLPIEERRGADVCPVQGCLPPFVVADARENPSSVGRGNGNLARRRVGGWSASASLAVGSAVRGRAGREASRSTGIGPVLATSCQPSRGSPVRTLRRPWVPTPADRTRTVWRSTSMPTSTHCPRHLPGHLTQRSACRSA